MHICKNMIAEVKVFPYRLSVVLGAVRSSSSPPFQLVFIFSKLFTEITCYFSIINKRERVFCLPISQKKFEAMLGMIRAGLGRRQNVGRYRAEDMGLQASLEGEGCCDPRGDSVLGVSSECPRTSQPLPLTSVRIVRCHSTGPPLARNPSLHLFAH